MLKEKKAIRVLLVLLDPQVNREKRVTEVFLVLQDQVVPKETLVLLVLQVLLVPSALQDYLVLQVPKVLKGHRVKLDQRERVVYLDLLDLLAHPVMLSTHSPSRLLLRADRVGTSTPARWWTMQPWMPIIRTTMTAWRKSSVRSTLLSWRLNR